MRECSFCLEQLAEIAYPIPYFKVTIRGDPDVSHYVHGAGHWFTCRTCQTLIDSNNLRALVTRYLVAWNYKGCAAPRLWTQFLRRLLSCRGTGSLLAKFDDSLPAVHTEQVD